MGLDKKYFSEQIITYIGNKRSLLKPIEEIIQKVCIELGKKKLIIADLFSGSGIVSRLLKQYSSLIIANDLEEYARILSECFLSNPEDFDENIYNEYLKNIHNSMKQKPIKGIISSNYAPHDDTNIKIGERVFYTRENAEYIDGFRYYLDQIVSKNYKKYFLALLITEASIHVNTSGVFKGFYKDKETGIGKFGGTAENALARIKGKIQIGLPVLSPVSSNYVVYKENTVDLSKNLPELDFVYLDPPYNQHPYGSNYFMLNIIAKNEMPNSISSISGIPNDWNRSNFNKKSSSLQELSKIVGNLKAKYILISYNDEGFITFEEMLDMLKAFGSVEYQQIQYNTFRGSRNLNARNLYTHEYLFLLRKE